MTEPGPLAEELARFLGAAQEWAHRAVLDPSTARIATGTEECCWCPICQLIATVRGERPELLEGWSQVQTAIGNLLRTAAETAPSKSSKSSNPEQPPARVQKIDLSDADGSGER